MARRFLSGLLLDAQVLYERLPGRGGDHLVASFIGLFLLIFTVFFFAASGPSAPAASSAPLVSLKSNGLYLFDRKRVSPEWFWFLSLARSSGWRGHLRSGVRTYSEQSRLYDKFRAGTGAPAFPPDGPSRHMRENNRKPWQHAVDVSYSSDLLRVARASRVHLKRPYASEPWHLEAARDFGPSEVTVSPAAAPPQATLPPPVSSPPQAP